MPRSAKVYGIDNSWMVYEPCHWCGIRQAINNHPDRKVKRMRWRGQLICGRCVGIVRTKKEGQLPYEPGTWGFAQALKLLDRVASGPCLIKPKKRYRKKCDCIKCEAKRITGRIDGP